MHPARGSISDVFDLYDKALSQTRGGLEARTIEGTLALDGFYRGFLRHHVVSFAPRFDRPEVRRELHRTLQERNHSSSLRFWAIDGACLKVDTSDIAIFYGGGYVVKGELGLNDNPPELVYRESEPGDDSSIVAYLPLSPEDLTIVDPEDRFVVSDQDRVSNSGLDTGLMLLAENYLCYRGASGPDHPHLLLWDQSLSGVLANATPNVTELRLSGALIGGETVWYPDLLVGYSKPWSYELDVPSRKAHRLWERAVSKLYSEDSHELDLDAFAKDVGLTPALVDRQLAILWKRDRYGSDEQLNPDAPLAERDGRTLKLTAEYVSSPAKIERLYQYFCGQLFRNKDPSVLIYEYVDEQGLKRKRFLSRDEISFLMAIGLRLTFEHCWRNRVSFVGVVKDSASTYFTNHYLGVLRHVKERGFSFTPSLIPATDRLTIERIPYLDDSIRGPWGTTEFDSVFMTLRMRKETRRASPKLQGVRGDILVPPNIIMRSLIQFHLKRQPPMDPSAGHAIFVDRLIDPVHPPPERATVITGDPNLGTITPYLHRDNSTPNLEQEITIYLLSTLTRNVFPEVVGYPDPLHLADRGAKAVLRTVEPMLRSSERLNRTDPLHRTLRQLRGG